MSPAITAAAAAARRVTGDTRFFRRWAALAILLLIFPYALLALLTPSGDTYSGAIYHPNDYFFYANLMLHGHDGELWFTNYFTYHQRPALPLHAFYFLAGRLVPWDLGPVAMALTWHGLRLVLAALFIQQAWKLFHELLPGRASRRAAMMFLLFTSGLAFYQLLLPLPHTAVPFDLGYTESGSFFELLFSPHFAAVLLLLAIYLRAIFRVVQLRSWTATVVGAVAATALFVIHPDKAPALAIGVLIYLALTTARGHGSFRAWLQAGLTLVPAMPFPLLVGYLALRDSQMIAFLPQNTFVSPGILGYAFGYGIPGACAAAGIARLFRRRSGVGPGELLLWGMVIAGVGLALAGPLFQPRRSVEGVQLAIAGLAGRNLTHLILPRFWRSRLFAGITRRRPFSYSRRRLRLLSINLVLILSSTTVLALSLAAPRAALQDKPELYLRHQDVGALAWLRTHGRHQDVVVGSDETEQFVVAYGGTHVVFGHFAWTPDVGREHQALIDFFGLGRGDSCQAESSGDPHEYLRQRGVNWIYYGPRERRCRTAGGPDRGFDPERADYITPEYRDGDTTIYRVSR